jgi:hypothetical protein
VREESHLDEMRDAIRGDFERLAERRGEQELMRALELDSEPDPSDQPAEVEPEPELEADSEPERRSWLARLLSP